MRGIRAAAGQPGDNARTRMDWLTSYRKEWLRPDVLAGLTTAAVVIPKALAYATIAGLPVQVGLYTVLVPMAVYALVGTSRVLSVSTSTTLAILVGAELAQVASGADAGALIAASAAISFLAGIILVAAALLRLGFVASFISEPVLIGFKAGVGLVIVVDQIPKLLGIHFHKGTFLSNVGSIVAGLPRTSGITLAVGAIMIVLLVGIEHFWPKLPAPLFAVGAGIAGTALLGLSARGVETVGDIPRGVPSLHMPDVSMFHTLWPAAAGQSVWNIETSGMWREGTPRGMSPTVSTPRALRPSSAVPAIPAPTANRGAGSLGQKCSIPTSSTIMIAPTASVMPEVRGSPATIDPTLDRNVPLWKWIPRSLGIWSTTITSPTPALNPMRTGSEMKLATKPSRRSAAATRMMPARNEIAAEAAISAPASAPEATCASSAPTRIASVVDVLTERTRDVPTSA